uniref:Codanin-1 C-terminal domain-containing protein n=1 Tax=Corethron hystrix TaxID=216773 RepID=A0A7S1BNA0_9STRA|mmetsp:Transcript_35077/g.81121  ORF Transcript_35077/g.81121 Transcript_35077/m.81121 type:complete len:1510 (+) Transcript_35077:69-4598(+)
MSHRHCLETSPTTPSSKTLPSVWNEICDDNDDAGCGRDSNGNGIPAELRDDDDSFILWLSSYMSLVVDRSPHHEDSKKKLSRVDVSFCILNGIRETVAPFLCEGGVLPAPTTPKTSKPTMTTKTAAVAVVTTKISKMTPTPWPHREYNSIKKRSARKKNSAGDPAPFTEVVKSPSLENDGDFPSLSSSSRRPQPRSNKRRIRPMHVGSKVEVHPAFALVTAGGNISKIGEEAATTTTKPRPKSFGARESSTGNISTDKITIRRKSVGGSSTGVWGDGGGRWKDNRRGITYADTASCNGAISSADKEQEREEDRRVALNRLSSDAAFLYKMEKNTEKIDRNLDLSRSLPSLPSEGKTKSGAWESPYKKNTIVQLNATAKEGNFKAKSIDKKIISQLKDISVKNAPTIISDDATVQANISGDSICAPIQPPSKNSLDEKSPFLLRLSRIYSTIILRGLIPSILVELHLVLRLASFRTSGTSPITTPKNNGRYSHILSTSASITTFGQHTLNHLEPLLLHLDVDTLGRLLDLPVFSDTTLAYPIIKRLSHILRLRLEDLRRLAIPDIGSPQKVPHVPHTEDYSNLVALPFDPIRDSRHNYRSASRSAAYSNRESTRDVFLSSLRNFQEVKTLHFQRFDANPEELARIVHIKLREGVANVMGGLAGNNFAWFAGLFVDLLLQVGGGGDASCWWGGESETDREVLGRYVANLDKLQKLHRRFSAKGTNGQFNKKLILERPDKQISTTFLQPPEFFFPGNQEYFFLFIRYSDSYRFTSLLLKRLTGELLRRSNIKDPRGLQERLLTTKLLAKFVAYIIFSPGWTLAEDNNMSADVDSEANQTDADSLLEQYSQTGFPLKELVLDAWRQRRLIAVIPWVIEYLRMMKWDSVIVRRSLYYGEVLAILKSVYGRLQFVNDTNNVKMFLRLEFEILFHEVLDRRQTESIPIVDLFTPIIAKNDGSTDEQQGMGLDGYPLSFNRHFLLHAHPQLEEIHKLLQELKNSPAYHHGNSNLGGSMKKLRPHAITSKALTTAPLDGTRSSTGLLNTTTMASSSSIQRRLIDSFFHKHPDLQISESLADANVKNTCAILTDQCILPFVREIVDNFKGDLKTVGPPSLTSSLLDSSMWSDMVHQIEQKSIELGKEKLTERCQLTIKPSIRMFVRPSTSDQVIEVATILLTRHALLEGSKSIENYVRVDVKKQLAGYIRLKKKLLEKDEGVETVIQMTSVPDTSMNEPNGSSVMMNEIRTSWNHLLKDLCMEEDFLRKCQNYPEITNSLQNFQLELGKNGIHNRSNVSRTSNIHDIECKIDEQATIFAEFLQVNQNLSNDGLLVLLAILEFCIVCGSGGVVTQSLKKLVRCFCEKHHILHLLQFMLLQMQQVEKCDNCTLTTMSASHERNSVSSTETCEGISNFATIIGKGLIQCGLILPFELEDCLLSLLNQEYIRYCGVKEKEPPPLAVTTATKNNFFRLCFDFAKLVAENAFGDEGCELDCPNVPVEIMFPKLRMFIGQYKTEPE